MDQAANLREIVKLESDKSCHLKTAGQDGLLSGEQKPKVFTIASGKGGVGKTKIVVNLAIACQRLGKRVLIFDADLGLANIDIIFGLDPQYTIDDLISGKKDLRHLHAPEFRRTGILRIFQQARRKRFILRGLFAPAQHTRPQPCHSIDYYRCGQHPVGQHIVSDGDFLVHQCFTDTVINPLLVPADKN